MTMDPKTQQQIKSIAQDLVRIDRRVRAVERTPRLAHSSFAGKQTIYDKETGEVAQVIGLQPDGAYALTTHNGTPPPIPSAPIITSGAGVLGIEWDGKSSDDSSWPTDFSHIEVHVSMTVPFESTDANEVASFHSIAGGTITIPRAAGTYFVQFNAVNTSRVESGPSLFISGVVTDPTTLNSNYWSPEPPWTEEDPNPDAVPGDTWYDEDDGNHPYIWDGDSWEDARDLGIDLLEAVVNDNISNIATVQQDVENVSETAFSAIDLAETADGRVSISDYDPGPEDIESRNPGSIWLTRTRNRRNLVTNPSFEVNTDTWTFTNATAAVQPVALAVAGLNAAQITNTGGTTLHTALWGPTTVVPGQSIAASGYATLVSGSGVDYYMELVFSDVSVTEILVIPSSPATLVTNDWARLNVMALVPEGAVTVSIRFRAPATAGVATDVWQLDGVLLEHADDIGRYFDGRSFDGVWEGAADASPAQLLGGKVRGLHELRDGDWSRIWWSDESMTALNANKITEGTLDGAIIGDNTIATDKMLVATVTAFEALSAGDLVQVDSNAGMFVARKASAAVGTARRADGFVLEDVAIGGSAKIHFNGFNPFGADLLPGTQFLSTTPGKFSASAPTASGSLVQRVGFAPNSYTLNFASGTAVTIT